VGVIKINSKSRFIFLKIYSKPHPFSILIGTKPS
jgi:hypothetical protein